MKSTLKKLAAAACLSAGALLMGVGASTAAAVTSLPDGERLYMIESNDSFNDYRLFEIAADGTATLVGDGTGSDTISGDYADQAAWDWETGLAYFGDNLALYSMDIETGVATQIGPFTGDFAGGDGIIAIDDSGNAFVRRSHRFATLDLATLATTELSGSSVNNDAGFYYFEPFAFNVADGNFYVINSDNTENDVPPLDNMLYQFSGTSAAIAGTPGVDLNGDGPVDADEVQNFRSMSFDSNGVGWLLENDGNVANLYTLDPATATLDLVGPVTHNGSHLEVYSTFIGIPGGSTGSGAEGLAKTGGNAASALAAVLLGVLAFGTGIMLRRRTHHSV